MNVIKHGKVPTERFECGNCGCIFEVGPNEYDVDTREMKLTTTCPDCKRLISKDDNPFSK